MRLFGSSALRARLRIVATALVAALVTTLLTVIEAPEGGSPAEAADRFPLAVRVDLEQAVGPAAIAVGAAAVDVSNVTMIDGAPGLSGLVRVTDEDGRLAGTAIAPKDDTALLGLHDDGPLDLAVNYETTAFSLFAMQPGVATTVPSVTVLVAALVMDLPEMDALTVAVEQAAAANPLYLDDLSPEIDTALAGLLAAFERRVDQVRSQLGITRPGETTTTTSSLRGLASRGPRQTPPDPDGCRGEQPEELLVVDVANQDHVCISEAEFNGSTWTVGGTSSTPRWAIARAVNRGVPVEQLQIVPGKSLSIPSLEGLAFDLAEVALLGQLDEVVNAGIHLCNAAAWLIGKRCDDPDRGGVVQRFIDKVESYFADAEFSFELNGSEAQTVLSINGFGLEGGTAGFLDRATSGFATVVMTGVVPAIGIFVDVLDVRDIHRQLPDRTELVRALSDTAATLTPSFTRFFEEIQAGDVLDRLEALTTVARDVIRATIDSGLLLVLLEAFFRSSSRHLVADQLASLATSIATGPVKWIDLGIDVLNAGVTLVVLADDLFELHTSARYALGYEEAPADPEAVVAESSTPIASPPVPNPQLPTEECGLRVAVVLDISFSIVEAGGEADVRDAATEMVNAFGSTPTSMRISTFAGKVTTQLGWTSLAPGDARRAARDVAQGIQFDDGAGPGSGTNWQAALYDLVGNEADLVVFVTDGNPNRFGDGITSDSDAGTNDFDPHALAAGVDAANILKANGTRVVAVGVGDVNVDPLRQVSGSTRGEDYFTGDLHALAPAMATIAGEVCGSALVIRHLVGEAPTAGAAYRGQISGQLPVDLVTAADGTARLAYGGELDDDVAGLSTSVEWPVGSWESVECERGGDAVADLGVDPTTRTLRLELSGVVTCTFVFRQLSGVESELMAVVEGPGELVVASFAPDPDAQGTVTACAPPRSSQAAGCERAAFGVDFAAGFAVLRYNADCEGCEPFSRMSVVPEEGRVRFEVDAPDTASGPALGSPTWLSVTVDGRGLSSQPPAPTVEGAVNADLVLEIIYRRATPYLPVCLYRSPGSGSGVVQDPFVRLGAGC